MHTRWYTVADCVVSMQAECQCILDAYLKLVRVIIAEYLILY